MKIATLFSGIGAPEQGAQRVYGDFETVFACEFDNKLIYDIIHKQRIINVDID